MLFTRCPDCETTFRITAEALRKANGQVRCGRCARVFNAYHELRRRARRKVAAMREEAVAASTSQPAAATGAPEPAVAAGAPEPALAPPRAPLPPLAADGAASDTAASQAAAHASDGVSRDTGERPRPNGAPPSVAAAVAKAQTRRARAAKKVAEEEKDFTVGDISLAGVIAELAASAASDDADARDGAKGDAPGTALPAGALLEKNGLGGAAAAGPPPADAKAAAQNASDDTRGAAAPAWVVVDDAARKRVPTWTWGVGSIAATVLLAVQVLHHYRNDLAVLDVVGPALRHAYAMLGVEIAPHWNLDQYEIVIDWDAVTQPSDNADNRLTIAARIRNKGPSPIPLPHVQVRIKDRWESTLGSRVFAPAQYLPPGAAVDRAMIAGQIAVARLAIVDPGPQAYGFEVDVCVDAESGALRCAADEVFR
ncbi:MAG TPA: zinc-ribbon and DUF3426 domain-containing protein [Gammaproteobacteria bacterium]